MAEETQVPVLNPAAAGQSLSSINKAKKKRISKNVLGLPDNAKIKPPIISDQEESEILALLRRHLPSARLPIVKKEKTDGEELPKTDPPENQEQKDKRSEMSMGVNELTRDIKKNRLASALLASDIVPSHLTAHLNFKCSQNKIPYLYLSNLREVTQEALGFPCIALGFRKNCKSFPDIVGKIFETYDQFKKEEPVPEEEIEVNENEKKIIKKNKSKKIKTEPEFTYKYRSSTKERAFVPENENKTQDIQFDGDFIPLPASDDEVEGDSPKKSNEVSQKLNKKCKKKKFNLESMEIDNIGMEESEEVKKQKFKGDWMIDCQPDNKNFKYAKANIVKYQSNPSRKRKSKFMKKKKFFNQGKNK